jgi:hypothetical protein
MDQEDDNLHAITASCKWCNDSLTGSPLRWEVDSVKPIGAVIDHMKLCSKFLEYQNRVSKLAVEWK